MDKFNKLAILNTVDFTDKIENCIKDMKCEELKIDPINVINYKVNDIVKHGRKF